MSNIASRTVDYFLRLQRTLVVETREFRDLRHNDDLCPRAQLQLENVLNATGRFEPIVYDTQGFHDQGADIVIRVRDQRRLDQEPPELIGFQLKSFGDFRGRDLLKNLKAQRDDALERSATYPDTTSCCALTKHETRRLFGLSRLNSKQLIER